jgi:hypothetical protein
MLVSFGDGAQEDPPELLEVLIGAGTNGTNGIGSLRRGYALRRKAVALMGGKLPILAKYGLDLCNGRTLNREVEIPYWIAPDRLGDEMSPTDIHAAAERKRAVHDEKFAVIS